MTIITVDDPTTAQWEWAGEQDPKDGTWSYDDIATVVERVNRGAHLLDEQEPGWQDKVFPDRLSMRNGEFCIIGQVYGSYDQFIGVPFGLGQTLKGSSRLAVDHGFITQLQPAGEDEDMYEGIPWALLDAVWVAMITARSEANGPVFLSLPPQLPRNRMINLMSELVEV